MRTEIKNYLASKLDKDKKFQCRNFYLLYNSVMTNYDNKGFIIYIKSTDAGNSIISNKNREKIVENLIKKANKKLKYKKFTWKNITIKDLEHVWDMAYIIDNMIDIRYKRIKENEKLKSISEDFV